MVHFADEDRRESFFNEDQIGKDSAYTTVAIAKWMDLIKELLVKKSSDGQRMSFGIIDVGAFKASIRLLN